MHIRVFYCTFALQMKKNLFIGFLLFFSTCLKAQTDSAFLKKYPFLIGNIAFGVDSLETPLGVLYQGQDTGFSVGMYNAGKSEITLTPGKSNRFVSITYDAGVLRPGTSVNALIRISVPKEMPEGQQRFEAEFQTDDSRNPFKFLYFVSEIRKGTTGKKIRAADTVPRIIFDAYLYDFGHMRKGKTIFYTFRFTNGGNKPLLIYAITPDKGVKITGLPEKMIPPGESSVLGVKLKTRRYVGVLHKSITIRSNDPVNPVITLGIHGTVKIIPSKKNPTDYCIGD